MYVGLHYYLHNKLLINWYHMYFVFTAEELPPCPTSFRQISVDDQFVPDSGIKRLLSKFYHPGSTFCFRSRTSR